VLSNAENPAIGTVFRKFPLGGKALYLLCRGTACERPRGPT